MTRLLGFVSLVAFSLHVAAPAIFAQGSAPAQLRVTVVDQTGGGVPQAAVRVTLADGMAVDGKADDPADTVPHQLLRCGRPRRRPGTDRDHHASRPH